MSGRKTDRLDRMRKMLMTENGITIREFAGKLDVSEITVRRDLKLLEKTGLSAAGKRSRHISCGRKNGSVPGVQFK